MITAGVTGLIAGRKGIVNIALDAEGFPPDRVYDRMAIAPQIGVLGLGALDQLQDLRCRMNLERFAKQNVETLGALGVVHAGFYRFERGQAGRRQ